MTELTPFGEPAAVVTPVADESRARERFARFRAAPHKTLSYGLGNDSTDVLLEFLRDPAFYGLAEDLSDLTVVHAVVGSEFSSTLTAVEEAILPRLREYRVRLVQVARRGPRMGQGYEVLSDTRQPYRLHRHGGFTLLEEMETGGTVPQAAGGNVCSAKFKAFPLDRFVEDAFGGALVGKAIGYNADEVRRADKSDAAQAKTDTAAGRAVFALDYPLIRTGRTRADVARRVQQATGRTWEKSYCWFCVYSLSCAAMPDHLARLRKEPAAAARALRLEYVSMALNENGSLYPDKDPLHAQVTADGNTAALGEFEALLNDPGQDWALYRVRRVYTAKRTERCREQHPSSCRLAWCRDRAAKGNAWRSVRIEATGTRAACRKRLEEEAAKQGAALERDRRHGSGIDRLYLRRLPSPIRYGAAEEFLVCAPATAVEKARKNFSEVWQRVAVHGLPA